MSVAFVALSGDSSGQQGAHLGPKDAQLHELRSGCGKASCVLSYDGVHDGLFRYSSRSFFSLRHMYTYADQLIGSGMKVEAYAKSQQRLVATTLPPDAQRPQHFTAVLVSSFFSTDKKFLILKSKNL
ncbi:hypothetical protein CHLRE_15g643704v5 [Chlamydomonas reinhardtii]|uniref:Uncharacterized protein n=1 Tax=Chlamydomonas reinhardtii TaxID=3055 RepID=A0A2K3CWZ9_CHLRE|nr:uncharacterized protein CHLRE_15g643704v5 [Chlamydomonas reinhardtii]PNW72801.1 hypothetical protein CHLRE_15g643704v5 [Chlamydomonas reinhardtii]